MLIKYKCNYIKQPIQIELAKSCVEWCKFTFLVYRRYISMDQFMPLIWHPMKCNIIVACYIYIVYYNLCFYSRSPRSVPKLLFWRQPWLPGGQGWATAQLCSYWTVYWLADATTLAEHHSPHNHPLLQWPLREQARVQTDLSGWVSRLIFLLLKRLQT